jgi:hypothetical protein
MLVPILPYLFYLLRIYRSDAASRAMQHFLVDAPYLHHGRLPILPLKIPTALRIVRDLLRYPSTRLPELIPATQHFRAQHHLLQLVSVMRLQAQRLLMLWRLRTVWRVLRVGFWSHGEACHFVPHLIFYLLQDELKSRLTSYCSFRVLRRLMISVYCVI